VGDTHALGEPRYRRDLEHVRSVLAEPLRKVGRPSPCSIGMEHRVSSVAALPIVPVWCTRTMIDRSNGAQTASRSGKTISSADHGPPVRFETRHASVSIFSPFHRRSGGIVRLAARDTRPRSHCHAAPRALQTTSVHRRNKAEKFFGARAWISGTERHWPGPTRPRDGLVKISWINLVCAKPPKSFGQTSSAPYINGAFPSRGTRHIS